ncbi:transport system permease protein [Halorubrum lacusprofundi ATCC 49239]|uniref:Transport system permease protein n=2 Tax=Halorubrum lacusprofundi TaxID=2247 RepID=B9LPZ5_HALLT|nr:transport system permease protein [Halorubrum lacusprofundi ATCC 49239]
MLELTDPTNTYDRRNDSGHMSVPDQSNRTRGIVGGAAAGAVAYVLGYLVVYVTQGDRIAEGLSGVNFFTELFGGDPISTWQAAGWLFYNAHFVDTMSPGVFGGAQSTNLIMEADGGSLLFILPPLLLLVAGVVAGRAAGASDPAEGAQAGAFVLTGYLPLAVIGAFLFRYTVGDGSVAPDLITAVLLAGAVYPAVFGAIGGAASSLLSD